VQNIETCRRDKSAIQVEHFLEDDDSVSRKTSLVEREDSAISGLTTEGDEVTYSIKVTAVKIPCRDSHLDGHSRCL
jgi:hypothetical protein